MLKTIKAQQNENKILNMENVVDNEKKKMNAETSTKASRGSVPVKPSTSSKPSPQVDSSHTETNSEQAESSIMKRKSFSAADDDLSAVFDSPAHRRKFKTAKEKDAPEDASKTPDQDAPENSKMLKFRNFFWVVG